MRMIVATESPAAGEAVSHGSLSPIQALRELIQAKSIIKKGPGEPDFELASGRHSRYYCDTKRVTLSPEGSWLVGKVRSAPAIRGR